MHVADFQWLGTPDLLFLGQSIGHAQARDVLETAFRQVFGRAGTLPELQYAQAVSLVEGGYGRSQYRNLETGESRVINNWGAAQCRSRPPCPANCFEATDTHADGSQYQACFAIYATPEAGAAAYLRTLYGGDRRGVLALAGQGRYQDAVTEQRATGYFEAPVERYWSAVSARLDQVASALDEPRGDSGAGIGTTGGSRRRSALPFILGAVALGAAAITFPRWRGTIGV